MVYLVLAVSESGRIINDRLIINHNCLAMLTGQF
jgi:hypothetical protein